MKDRLLETRGIRFELLRHFLPQFFDSELVTSSASLAGGSAAILVSCWMLLTYVLLVKYKRLSELGFTPDRLATEVRSDLASLTWMSICATIVLAAALWQSLYPSLRDYLALAGFPISGADIFLAKFTAAVAVFIGFLLVLALPTTTVFSALTGASFVPSITTIAAACACTFFGLLAVQGLLLNVLPSRWFERVMIAMQAVLAAIGLGAFPLAGSSWHDALLGISWRWLTLVLVAPIVYLLSFQRYQRLVLEAPQACPPRRMDFASRLLELCIRDPRALAAFGFIWKTIQRNRIHRLAVLVYAALAIAWIASSSATNEGAVLTAGPVGLVAFTLLGLRHLFSLPAELRANWMFQIAEREGRLEWMRAVEQFVMGFGVVPMVLLGAAFVVRADGWMIAAAWAPIAYFAAAIGFERFFKLWRKMPFTCTYLPGKRPLIINLSLFFSAMLMLVPVSHMLYYCASNPASAVVTLTLEIALWSYLRAKRLKTWGLIPLLYEDQLEPELEASGFLQDGTILAQEEFQREWKEYLRGDISEPVMRPLEADETRAGRVWNWLKSAPGDLRFALRLLIQKPGYAASVVLTLGLGLGLNAAFFTVFNALLLRPLAVRDPGSLISVNFESEHNTPVHLDWKEYQALSASVVGLSGIAASSMEGTGLDGHAAKVAMVSANFFSLLGAGTALGRPFESGENEAVMVLSYRTWQNRFGSDPGILGRRLLVQGVPFEVIGVAAPEFVGVNAGTIAIAPPEIARFGVIAADFWVPIEVWSRMPNLPQYPIFGMIARLPQGVSEDHARQMLTGIARHVTSSRERYDRIIRVTVESLDIPITWTALEFSLPLLIAFGLTMLIPCANAANIMLARSMTRQRELGTRLSLGASRGRIVRQLLAEALVLALLAGVVGIAASRLAVDLFSRILYATAPSVVLFRIRIPDFKIDTHVFVYMLMVAGLTTLLFGLAPALQATRVPAATALRGEIGIARPSRLRDALVVLQVAACMMLLAISAVLLRGSQKGVELNRGYQAQGVFGVANQSPEDAAALVREIDKEPWVGTRAFMAGIPTEMGTLQSGHQNAYFMGASGSYFQLLQLPLVRGRTFTEDEDNRRAPVVVVSELAASRFWPGEDPIGKTLTIEPGDPNNIRRPRFHEAKVIGVCRDIVVKVKDGGVRPAVYFPETLRRGTMVAVRGRGNAEATARQLEAVLARSPGSANGARVVALQEALDWQTYPQRAAAWLSSLLGVVAFLLTMTGIYGVMSYAVNQRTKEIGIRMALGATPASLVRLVTGYSARMTCAGLAFGTILALGVLQYCASKVDLAVNVYDVPAYALSVLAVTTASLLAVVPPARRACAVDPQQAVRAD